MTHNTKLWLIGLIVVVVLAGGTTLYRSQKMGMGLYYNGGMSSYEGRMGGEPSMGYSSYDGMGSSDAYYPSESTGLVENKMASMPILPPYYDDGLALDAEYRMYDKSADFSVIVDDVQVYLRSMREYILSVDGVVLNDSFNRGDKWVAGTLYAKVPIAVFPEASNRAVENVEEIYASYSSSNDVTGSHVSASDRVEQLQSMLATTQATLEQTQALLAQAPEGSDQWRQYRSEVLQLEARVASYQRSLDQASQNVESIETRVEYATLSLTAADSSRYFDPNSNVSLYEQFIYAIESLGESWNALVSFLVWVVVYSVFWVPAMAVYLWVKKRRQAAV